MRYTYKQNVIGMNLYGYDIEAANIGGREWRLAIVDCPGAVKNKFVKVGEYAEADFGDVPGTTMFWSFDHAPTIGEVDKIIREYKSNKAEHEAFMKQIGAKA